MIILDNYNCHNKKMQKLERACYLDLEEKIIILDNFNYHNKQMQKIGESVLPGLGGEEGDVDGVEASVLFLQDVFIKLKLLC